MRILMITYRLPVDLYGGDKSTIHHLLKFLSARHEIVLLSFIDSESLRDQLDLVAPFCERVELVYLPKWRSYLNCLGRLASSDPLQVSYYRSAEMTHRIRELLRREPFDLVYGYHLRTGQYLKNVVGCPRVFDLKPVQTLNLRRMQEHVSDPLKKLMYRIEYDRVRRYERGLVRDMDRCFVICDADREAIDPDGELPQVILNPHGIDPVKFAPDPSCHQEPNSLVFSGKMGYEPNADAAVYFCENILPLVTSRVPDVKLYLVGADPQPCVTSLARDPSVVVTGFVDDIRPYLHRAQIAIDPLRIGAGLQNKVLEGMAMGMPMVVTSVANEGIQAEPGRDLLVADTAAEFADRIVELLHDPDRRTRLGAAARQFIVNHWTWEKHFEQFEHILLETVQPAPARETAAAV
jgi:hypothetical protein